MMYDDRYQRRQMRYQRRQMRRMNRRSYRNTLGGISGGIFFLGLALAFGLANAFSWNLFLPIFFVGLAFCSLIGSASSFNPRGLYGGMQGFAWLLGLAACFYFGFWPWILVVIGVSSILGSLYVPLTAGRMGAGLFASMQSNQQQQYPPNQGYQQPGQPYPPGQEPYQPYQQGYQPQPGDYVESGQPYQYPHEQQPQPKQEYDQPQVQYPEQELPPQQ